jgi:hypothetical protein
MSANPRMQARNARANLTPAGVPAEMAAPQKAPEPAAPILAAEAADKPKRARRPKEAPP